MSLHKFDTGDSSDIVDQSLFSYIYILKDKGLI